MTTLQMVELGVLGPLQVRQDGAPVIIPGAKPRALLTMLGLHGGSLVPADTLVEVLWGDDPPRTAPKALQTHISSLRRALGDGFVVTEGDGWTLAEADVDASRYKAAAQFGRDAAAAGDTSQAVARFEEALALWRGVPGLPDTQRGTSEKTRWIESHAALIEDRADALLATGRAAEIIGDLEAAVTDAPLRERRWGQLMLGLYRAGRQGEALGAYQRARALLADELGVDPGPDLRRLEAAIVAQDTALEIAVTQEIPAPTRTVTFLLTDIEGSTAAWEVNAAAMAVALARHDELVEQAVTSRGGRLIKTQGEGDATFSVFERPSAAAAAAIELQEAIVHEPWALREPMRIRVALHTGEVEFRDGDYFGRAVNRAARLRSLATGGQILCSGATAELVIDSLADDVVLVDRGMRQLRNLPRPEHVFELRLETADDQRESPSIDAPLERPSLPAVLAGPGPFVGRGRELEQLIAAWQTVLAGGTNAVLIAGEPGVGKTRLAGEWSRQAYDLGALVIYGRCDEDLGAPYQPFAEALRSLVPCLSTSGLRGLRGVEALLPLVPGLTDVLPDLAAPTRADPDTERYALFDAVVALLGVASASAPVVLILDDLHWAAKSTLLLLRHLLRFGEQARVQVVGTYRSTDLDRSHPLAAMLADLHRDGTANRIQLSGLDETDVTAYVFEAGYDDEELARALASVTGGNPFFLIEALRHVEESGGHWDPSTLPQGVREAVSRRLSRLPAETNKALAAAAVVGSRFAVDLVERVLDQDLIDAFDEASQAGIVIEEPGGRYRFNHALVRQSLLAELASVRRLRLHQRIATTLENQPGADDELLAELAYHYFECAWAGNAAKAVEYCRRAADQAMTRLAYEGAADLYDRALHALEEIDDELPDRDEQVATLLIARCEALLAAGDVASASGAVAQLQESTLGSARLAAWATCFDGELSMLIHPERLDEVEAAVGAAAGKLAELDDAAGEAKAHTVRAACLGRLGRIGDCEIALDDALTAARRARDHRRVNAVLAGAPLAALWGPNPVPRAGGRCLDVVRLLRITTDSPAVEATSTRCQAVLEAFRGRAAAARRMIDSARRTVTELGLRHALAEVEQFAGIIELIVDDPAAAEPHLRQAYNGFRRMGLDADTAETAALLGRTCLALGRDAEADELCSQSERLAGHALKASIAWRTLRAQLLSRGGVHDEARRVAEAAVTLAESTDALVDHGDACLTLATVVAAAGDGAGARAAAERSVGLYERKGAAALTEKARRVVAAREVPTAPAAPETPSVKLDNACVRAIRKLDAAFDREAWDEVENMYAPDVFVESRRKTLGFTRNDLPSGDWPSKARRLRETGGMRHRLTVIAVRGERLALTQLEIGTSDSSAGAPHDEVVQLCGIDTGGRIALQTWFDVEDMDAAIAELDVAYARFEEQRSGAPLANAASRADERFNTLFAGRRWDEISALLTDDVRVEDRRRGLRREGNERTAKLVDEVRAIADLGVKTMSSNVLAIRGERLALVRTLYSGRDERPEAFRTELLRIAQIDADERIVGTTAFDLDDFDAAIAELDGRYLAGEAAAHAHTWSLISQGFAALNRREMPPTTPDWVNIDHRRGTSIAPGEMPSLLGVAWNVASHLNSFIEKVHRLNNLGAVVTHMSHETSQEGFHAEWRVISVLTLEGELLHRCEVFDETDLDAAIARFEQLSRPQARLENPASRVDQRLIAYFGARDWDAMADMLADDYFISDRRRVVNNGLRQGRVVTIEEAQASANLGLAITTSEVIATRGDCLALSRTRWQWSGPEASESFHTEVLNLVEINADGRMTARVWFEADDFDAAFGELDARYLAGEAAAYAHTWSVITRGYATLNRHELPAMTTDLVSIDHRRGASYAPGELIAYVRAGWELDQDIRTYVEVVHRLSDLGAVCTHAAHGVSREGFDAEWRGVNLYVIEGDMVSRCELFDEADLDTAIARFEQLSRQPSWLENAASKVAQRFSMCFTSNEWDAMAEMMADNFSGDDRRRVVGAGVRHGRDAQVMAMRATADLWTTRQTLTVLAIRGERLALMRAGFSDPDQRPEVYLTELLAIFEIDADERILAVVSFDIDDIDAAFDELDARYLAGEAAAHARTWSAIAAGYAAVNRGVIPEITQDWEHIDHRLRTTLEADDLAGYLRAAWDVTPNFRSHVEAVHRLSDLGAVVTHASQASSHAGFDAEWRMTELVTVEDDKISRCELFDDADIAGAIARFEQLSRPTPRLENAATQVAERLQAHFMARDWAAIAGALADDICTDDRRRAVNAGIRHGRDAEMASLRATANVGTNRVTTTFLATRGQRLVLAKTRLSAHDWPAASYAEMVGVTEIDADNRVAAVIVFDIDNIDAAYEELDARYLAGEAATHAHTWSVIARECAAFNRRELPAADWVTIDHRRLVTVDASDLLANIRAGWDLMPELSIHIEAVHRLGSFGAIVTYTAYGTSHQGFGAEWRMLQLLTVEGDRIDRCEIFDEADLDAALDRFEELRPSTRRLENAASRLIERFVACFAARNWAEMSELLADDIYTDDRRRVVGTGRQRGQDIDIANMRVLAEIGVANMTSTVIATRGERLALSRARLSGRDRRPEAFHTELLDVVEINAENQMTAHIALDPNDFEASFAELDARYVAGDAAAHARTWSVIAGTYAGINRHELPPTTSDCINVDHRRLGRTVQASEMHASIRAMWDLMPDLIVYVEAVHRLSDLGAIVTHAAHGISHDGFDAEWRMIAMFTVEADLLNRCEWFDEADLDAAVARFDELEQQAQRLENVATQMDQRFWMYFAARDWAAMATMLSDDMASDDRRRIVNAGIRYGRDSEVANMRTLADIGVVNVTSTVIATRGARLLLRRTRFSNRDQGPEGFQAELLCIIEIDAEDRIAARVLFDPDDIDAAFEELDARYLSGEAAAHSQTWSLVASRYAALNRHELPRDRLNIEDRRRIPMVEQGDPTAVLRAGWDLTPQFNIHIEAVHRLSDRGAVVARVTNATSRDGFAAEWRAIDVWRVEGGLVTGCEIFDETDLKAALTRFDDVDRPPLPENAASSRV